MRLPLSWLSDLIDLPLAAPELADRLTHAGLKVDLVYRYGGARDALVVAKVIEAAPIPGTDHLARCVVDDGTARRTVVCGAPNARAGITVALALPGCRLPGGLAVAAREVRGVLSEGMLVSEREIGLSDDHAGIMELPGDLAPGMPFADWCDRHAAAFELDITANRGDALSALGVARDLAALLSAPLRAPWRAPKGGGGAASARIEIACPDLCRRYAGRIVRGVKVGPSPAWLAERLRGVGARPINNVVDVTNFMLFLTGHPIHAFDLARIDGGRIVVRRPAPGETIRTLDGFERIPPPDACLICDAARPVALGGVMGGADSGVTAGTRDVLVEVACFDEVSIRRTAKATGLKSDSSHRFERGIDDGDTLAVLDLACALLEDLAGGRAEDAAVDVRPVVRPERVVELSFAALDRFVGAPIPPDEAAGILASLGFAAARAADGRSLAATVPSWRHDIAIPEDLYEEILRVRGYGSVPSTLPRASSAAPVASAYARLQQARDAARALGFTETVGYSFGSGEALDRFDGTGARRATLRNALGQEFSVMRPTLLPALAQTVAVNFARGASSCALFELAPVYRLETARGEAERTRVRLDLPDGSFDVEENWSLAVALAAPRGDGWNGDPAPLDFFDLKGRLEAFVREMGGALAVRPAESPAPFLHPGVQGEIVVAGRAVGRAGLIHPARAKERDLPAHLLLAELDLSPLLPEAAPARIVPASRYPKASFDLALLVDRAVPHERLAATIAAAAGKNLSGIELFDVYEGDRLPAGTRSLAYTLTFQSAERTLTDEEVKTAVAAVVAALAERCGAKLREG